MKPAAWKGKLHSMVVNKFCQLPRKIWQSHSIKRATTIAVLSVSSLIACDGAVQLCGEYACVFYQTSCAAGDTCNEPKQCEAAGSIRDRAPRIINELRSTQRACSNNMQSQNRMRLVWDEKLASASQTHSQDMAKNRFELFQGSNGLTSTERVELVEFEASTVLESIGSGAQTTAEIINYWLDIQTDCNQMLTSGTSKIGMACTLSNEPDATPYWSLVLASPKDMSIQR